MRPARLSTAATVLRRRIPQAAHAASNTSGSASGVSPQSVPNPIEVHPSSAKFVPNNSHAEHDYNNSRPRQSHNQYSQQHGRNFIPRSNFTPRYQNRYSNNGNYVNHRSATYYMTPNQASAATALVHATSDNGSSIASVSPNDALKSIRSYSSMPEMREEPVTLVNLSLNTQTADIPLNSTPSSGTPSYVFSPENPDPRREMYVDTEEKLSLLIDVLRPAERIAVDIEFTSFPLYRPTVQLIQISTVDTVLAVIDCQPLQGMLLPLIELLNTKEVILHGGSVDLQVLHDFEDEYDVACTPAQLFDTQVAAAFIGMGETGPISLGNLVDEALDVHLEKGLGNSDWSRRPLSDEQIAYALDDVRYLHQLREVLLERMRTMKHIPSAVVSTASEAETKQILLLNREQLFRAEMEMIRLQRHDPPSPDEAWLQIRARPGQLNQKSTYILKALAKWREMEGMRQNKSPRFLIKDEVLLSLALRPPQSIKDLEALGYNGSYLVRSADVVLNLVRAIEQGETHSINTSPTMKSHLDRGEESLRQLMMSAASAISQAVSISADLLAPFNDLKAFLLAVKEEEEDLTALMRGFRRELIGIPLRRIKQGQAITLKWNPVERRIVF